uniref:Uncharacterized protein n=1 Tax=Lactuca sativa TaxID=4236 RepID=A0A9R1XXL5_LACSA|nr:hypothetical protein LSAT_V11C100015750 [Lactuca sativa]
MFATSSPSLITKVTACLSFEFSMTNLSLFFFFLGIVATRFVNGICIYLIEMILQTTTPEGDPQTQSLNFTLNESLLGWLYRNTTVYLWDFTGIFETILSLGIPNANMWSLTPTLKSITGYADWVGCTEIQQSTYGLLLTILSLGIPNANMWSLTPTLKSITGVANAVTEVVWLQNLLLELSPPLTRTMVVFFDNVNVMYLTSNPSSTSKNQTYENIFTFC